MSNSNDKKSKQLGEPLGTSWNRLRKLLLFDCASKLELTVCFQCGKKIDSVNELSIEHKIPWLDSDNPIDLFFDLDNVAFSHLSCNISAARRQQPKMIHGTSVMYNKFKCKCELCTETMRIQKRRWRARTKKN